MNRVLENNHVVSTVDQERQQFVDYYQIVLAELGLDTPPRALLQTLAASLVDDLNLEPFSDVPAALEALQTSGVRLGIVSNTWPSLEPKYTLLGVRQFFDAFVMSAQLGCSKPDERMFRHGLAGLALDPEHVLFVDDWPEYVQAAIDLGMQGTVMDRHGTQESTGLPRVTSMAEILALVC